MPEFPSELISLFHQHLANEYEVFHLPLAFRNSCLVSRSWREIAQPLLFSEVVLSLNEFGAYRTDKFCLALQKSPRLQSCVRRLWIKDFVDWDRCADTVLTLRVTINLLSHLEQLLLGDTRPTVRHPLPPTLTTIPIVFN